MGTLIPLYEVAVLLFLVAAAIATGLGVVQFAVWREYERRLKEQSTECHNEIAGLRRDYEYRFRQQADEINRLRGEVKMWSEMAGRMMKGGQAAMVFNVERDATIGGDVVGRDRDESNVSAP